MCSRRSQPIKSRRISSHGRRRHVEAGEILIEAGDPNVPCFVVLSGRLEIVQRDGASRTSGDEPRVRVNSRAKRT